MCYRCRNKRLQVKRESHFDAVNEVVIISMPDLLGYRKRPKTHSFQPYPKRSVDWTSCLISTMIQNIQTVVNCNEWAYFFIRYYAMLRSVFSMLSKVLVPDIENFAQLLWLISLNNYLIL